jgi:hypothetical protein
MPHAEWSTLPTTASPVAFLRAFAGDHLISPVVIAHAH